mmetsp:Transcript_51904/g.150809  ORF Transcript_51904/g.150809 Transcript_51904/m.150809 type:complete len:201 (-) Transcript_51904:331-933(-)
MPCDMAVATSSFDSLPSWLVSMSFHRLFTRSHDRSISLGGKGALPTRSRYGSTPERFTTRQAKSASVAKESTDFGTCSMDSSRSLTGTTRPVFSPRSFARWRTSSRSATMCRIMMRMPGKSRRSRWKCLVYHSVSRRLPSKITLYRSRRPLSPSSSAMHPASFCVRFPAVLSSLEQYDFHSGSAWRMASGSTTRKFCMGR